MGTAGSPDDTEGHLVVTIAVVAPPARPPARPRADLLQPAVSPSARLRHRPALDCAPRPRRAGRRRLPLRAGSREGRLSRRQHVLHPLGLPDHHPRARGALAQRPVRPPWVLAPALPAPAAGGRRGHRGGPGARGPHRRRVHPAGDRRGRRVVGVLRRQLAPAVERHLLRRALRGTEPARAHVVAGGGGAVLRGLSAGRGAAASGADTAVGPWPGSRSAPGWASSPAWRSW